jgi:ribosome-associated heat shock protein Hsp15
MTGGERLDKFLWQARLAKSRSLAARMIEAGEVLLQGRAVKPHHAVRAGDRVAIRRGRVAREIEVRALTERRGPATEARLLYVELASAPLSAMPAWEPLIEDDVSERT